MAYAWMPWVLSLRDDFPVGMARMESSPRYGLSSNAARGLRAEATKVAVPGLNVYRTSRRRQWSREPLVRRNRWMRPDWNFLATSGSSVFVAAILAAIWLRITPRVFCSEFFRTLFSSAGRW